MEKVKKLKLELDEVEVASFTMEKDDGESRGTVIANSTIYGCGYTVVYPRTCNPDMCPVATDLC